MWVWPWRWSRYSRGWHWWNRRGYYWKHQSDTEIWCDNQKFQSPQSDTICWIQQQDKHGRLCTWENHAICSMATRTWGYSWETSNIPGSFPGSERNNWRENGMLWAKQNNHCRAFATATGWWWRLANSSTKYRTPRSWRCICWSPRQWRICILSANSVRTFPVWHICWYWHTNINGTGSSINHASNTPPWCRFLQAVVLFEHQTERILYTCHAVGNNKDGPAPCIPYWWSRCRKISGHPNTVSSSPQTSLFSWRWESRDHQNPPLCTNRKGCIQHRWLHKPFRIPDWSSPRIQLQKAHLRTTEHSSGQIQRTLCGDHRWGFHGWK